MRDRITLLNLTADLNRIQVQNRFKVSFRAHATLDTRLLNSSVSENERDRERESEEEQKREGRRERERLYITSENREMDLGIA